MQVKLFLDEICLRLNSCALLVIETTTETSFAFTVLEELPPTLQLEQEPWRLPSRQEEFNRTDMRRLDYSQAVTGNQGYFEG